MREVVPLYKMPGETPLECIERFRLAFPEYENVPMTYAGRLDPMAHGLLLVLAGGEVHEKPDWLKRDKTYIVDILFGVGTDTYDALGIVEYAKPTNFLQSDIEKQLVDLQGSIHQKFPPYSAYKIQGRPLHTWARAGELDEGLIPKKERFIHSIQINDHSTIGSRELLEDINERVGRVRGDFRQDEILKQWKKALGDNNVWQCVQVEAGCSSGTYMRSLANQVGLLLGTRAIAWKIYRPSVGDMRLTGESC